MVLERYRGGWEAALAPLAVRMDRWGVTPDVLTVVSLLFAVFAAVAFALAAEGRLLLLLVASACVSLNAILDGLDGKLARMTNTATARGDYLDHVIDRYSDLAILAGIALSPLADIRWGLFAIVGTFLTSYMGTQAQALGLGRNYGGWLGRADRLVILIATPVVAYGAELLGYEFPVSLLTLMLAYFAIAGNVTALQRFRQGWNELKAQGR